MVQAHTKQNKTVMHLYSTCMENVSWSSKAEKYKTEPFGFQEEGGEGRCCALETPGFVSRQLDNILCNRADEYSITTVNEFIHLDVKIKLIAAHRW